MKQLVHIVAFLLMMVAAAAQAAQLEPININSADAATLTQLKGVGAKFAQRIVEYRQKNGPFSSGEDLQGVRGIGSKVYQSNRDRIVVSDPLPK
ncbi:MAG: helix-hairpin-helix domain-containing protein [Gammaproteobacteria bacterium]|jgi:competence protein ComEA|nr:helix-hairpin-helix domain-containing protein [Gammaproteobacteria bacterium]MBT4811657.1 helix-hairpin-helix domain-containing protein [Thiotrichales bacterium]MBT3471832.1 helix-hairpin-helix domain-containing protein [Gammaproteobacteria bacterium]MBT3966985.1 helix-hairpin-helix domain-containing protein [Gammaproteobacteria bacterium]MBT4081416.1 helix-hairpin-helix domain-containing protein [Gammaproteobacteria bacterium]